MYELRRLAVGSVTVLLFILTVHAVFPTPKGELAPPIHEVTKPRCDRVKPSTIWLAAPAPTEADRVVFDIVCLREDLTEAEKKPSWRLSDATCQRSRGEVLGLSPTLDECIAQEVSKYSSDLGAWLATKLPPESQLRLSCKAEAKQYQIQGQMWPACDPATI